MTHIVDYQLEQTSRGNKDVCNASPDAVNYTLGHLTQTWSRESRMSLNVRCSRSKKECDLWSYKLQLRVSDSTQVNIHVERTVNEGLREWCSASSQWQVDNRHPQWEHGAAWTAHHKSAAADTQCFMHLNCSDGALCPPSETRHLKKEENIKGEQGRMDSDWFGSYSSLIDRQRKDMRRKMTAGVFRRESSFKWGRR